MCVSVVINYVCQWRLCVSVWRLIVCVSVEINYVRQCGN